MIQSTWTSWLTVFGNNMSRIREKSEQFGGRGRITMAKDSHLEWTWVY